MSNKREALEAALSALESERIMAADGQGNYTVEVTPKRISEAIAKIKEALAEPEQEPVMAHTLPPPTKRDQWFYEQGRLAERDPRTSPREWPEQNPTFLVRIAHITEKPTGVFLPTDSPELRSEYLVPVYTSPREWQELSAGEVKQAYKAHEGKMTTRSGSWDSCKNAFERGVEFASAALRAKNGG